MKTKTTRMSFITIDDALATAKRLTDMLSQLGEYKHPLDVRKGTVAKHRKEVGDVAESKQMKGSGRTYFFDFKETKDGKAFLVITESRKGDGDKWERSSIMVFPVRGGATSRPR